MYRIDWHSLRFRLLAWLGSVALVVVVVTWLMHGFFLESIAKDFLGERLRREADHAVSQLGEERSLVPESLQSVSKSYQVFHHLYVLSIGDSVSASDPKWQTRLSPLLASDRDSLVEVEEGGRHLLVYRRHFSWEDSNGVLLIGEDFSQVEAGLATLHWWVGAVAGALLIVLIVLNMLAVNRGLKPLRELREQLDALQAGKRRRFSVLAPSELNALVEQLNRFMDDIDSRLQHSRESAANLSHALKTPLAAVTQVLRGNRPINDDRRLKLLVRIENINAQLDAELRRSRIAGPNMGRVTHLMNDSSRLIDMFRGLYPDKEFQITYSSVDRDQVPVEPHDFAEMLGILLDNGGKWAKHYICCDIRLLTETLVIIIDDDGPGVAESDLPRLGERGKRLDERHPGYGLGLSILTQLAARYAGYAQFSHSSLGGLHAEVILPFAEVAR